MPRALPLWTELILNMLVIWSSWIVFRNIDGSLKFFEMEESEYYEGMEEVRTAIEQYHYKNFLGEKDCRARLKKHLEESEMDPYTYGYEDPVYELPEILFRTITTRLRWNAYNKAKQRYSTRRDMFECSLQN
jgi:hypothetical protein